MVSPASVTVNTAQPFCQPLGLLKINTTKKRRCTGGLSPLGPDRNTHQTLGFDWSSTACFITEESFEDSGIEKLKPRSRS